MRKKQLKGPRRFEKEIFKYAKYTITNIKDSEMS